MTPVLLGLTAIIYSWVGLDYARQGRIGMALAFFAYALANAGFILDTLSTVVKKP